MFTAFADTAQYLYREVAPWALKELGLHAALVTGAGRNRTTLPNLRKDLSSILTAFSPRSKERPEEFADEGELDLKPRCPTAHKGLKGFKPAWRVARVRPRGT